MTNNKKLSGIYQFVNQVNSKRYIGSSIDLIKREKDHLKLLRKDVHHSSLFQRAYNKYGEENFKYEIIFFCKPEELLYYEQIGLGSYNRKELYNASLIAGSTLGLRHSDKANKEKSIRQTGRKFSQETKQKIGDAHRNRTHSEVSRKNMSDAHIGKMTEWDHPMIRPVIRLDLHSEKFIDFWVSALDVEKKLKIHRPNIQKCCRNEYGRKSAGDFKWRFATLKEIEFYKKENKIKGE